MGSEPIGAEVLAVIVAMVDGEPCVLTLPHAPRLPAGPLLPGHRSLQTAVRAWVEEQTGLTVTRHELTSQPDGNTILVNVKKTTLDHRPGWDSQATARSYIFRRDT